MVKAPKATNGVDSSSEALAIAIKREATKYVAKVVIATAVGIVGIAALGLSIYVKQFLPQLAGGVPPGAVMAFDLPSGCPQGWSIFQRGMSRTIVGASGTGLSVFDVPNLDANDQRLRARAYQSTGGEERHQLKIEEMPTRDRNVTMVQHGDYLRGNGGNTGVESVRFTETASAGQPFNVMPPYIALFYCKKD